MLKNRFLRQYECFKIEIFKIWFMFSIYCRETATTKLNRTNQTT